MIEPREMIERTNSSTMILGFLQDAKGEFVGDLYRRTGSMVHSRVADLRRDGYVIECKCFGRGDYRYRLVDSVDAEKKTVAQVHEEWGA